MKPLPKVQHQDHYYKEKLTAKQYEEYQLAKEASQLKYYCPNGAQEQFINTVAQSMEESKIPVHLVTFANGVGKTTTALQILFNIIKGAQNGWFHHKVFNQPWKFPKKVWYCSTAETLKDTVIPMVVDLFPLGEYKSSKDGKSYISRIQINGWEISFKTFDQDPKTYESANVGIIIGDEPMPEPLWKAIKSRRRLGCLTILPMTPLYCPPYVLDEIKKNVENNVKGYYHLEATVYEACRERGIRGHLDPEIVDAMVDAYDPEEREARAYGKPMYFAGIIYGSLSRAKHFRDPKDFPIPPGSKIYQAVDPHDGRPSAAIWAAYTPEIKKSGRGRWIIFAEYPTETEQPFWDMKKARTADAEVKEWIGIEAKFKIDKKIEERVMDRHFGWQTRGKTSLAEVFADAGDKYKRDFFFIESYDAPSGDGEIMYGHRQVRKALGNLPDGEPGLIILSNCYHTWNGLIHYIRKREVTRAGSDRAAADGIIVPKYKDLPDCVRYLVCHDDMPPAQEEPKTPMETYFKHEERDYRTGTPPELDLLIFAEEEPGGGDMDS